MPRLYVYDIEWDTDDDQPDLPGEIELEVDSDYDPDYEPAETLSREFGFCVKALSFDEIGKD